MAVRSGDDVPRLGLPISHYTWLLRAHFAKMLAFVILSVLATALVTLRMTPIYESTATLYIDRAAEKDVVGKDSVSATASFDEDAFLASQIRILQSDSVVRPLAEKYNLLETEKQIKPGKEDPAKTASIRSAPIVLKGLTVTRPPNTFILQISYRCPDPKVATEIANGIASYIGHIYDIRFKSTESLSRFLALQQDELRAKMEMSGAKLAALEKELQVVSPDEKTNVLSARLMELNTQYAKIQGDRAHAESTYNSLTSGSLEAALGSTQSEELRSIIKRLHEEQQKFADVKARYGPNYPEYSRLQSTVAELEAQERASVQLLSRQASTEFQRTRDQETLIRKDVEETKAQYDQLNLRSFEYQRAKQEAEADRTLYEELVKKIREGQINAGFKNDMVRIADTARPGSKPVSPSLPLNLSIAFVLSSLVAAAAVVVADQIDTTIKNPEEVSHVLNSRVIGVLPVLRKEQALASAQALAVTRKPVGVEIKGSQSSAFEEAIRTIRNSILLTDFDRTLRSVLMTSATPGEGKSTVAAHLAISHAEQHHRTLLIDGDMRRPSIHKLFRIPNNAGLSNVIERGGSWREYLIQPRPDIELYVLPAGPATRRSTDLLGQRLPQLLGEAAEEFDLTFLDAPPLLGFPEPLQMAAAADGVIVVARAGQTDRSAIAAVLDMLSHLRANSLGLILNQVKKENSSTYYYYGSNYGKYYAKRKGDAEERPS
jgi:capsular exopolysaccharide synthesis family protein